MSTTLNWHVDAITKDICFDGVISARDVATVDGSSGASRVRCHLSQGRSLSQALTVMHEFIAQLMSGKHRLLKSLAADSGTSTATAKTWLTYLKNAGVVDGLSLRVETTLPTPPGPTRLWQMAEALKLLKLQPHQVVDLAIFLNCTEIVAGTLLRNLTAVGVVDTSTGMLASELLTPKATAPWVKRITPTQLVTLRILARTGSIKATARERNVTTSTVGGMLKLIYSRMGVHSSTEAAYMIGLLDGANS